MRQEDWLLGLDGLFDINLILGSDLALVSFDSDPTAPLRCGVGARLAWLRDSIVSLDTMDVVASPDFVETPSTSTFEENSCADSVQKCQDWALITNKSSGNESYDVVMKVNWTTWSEAFGLPNHKDGDTCTPDEVPGKAVSLSHLCENVTQSIVPNEDQADKDGPQERTPSLYGRPSQSEVLHGTDVNVGELDAKEQKAYSPVVEIPIEDLIIGVLMTVCNIVAACP